MTTKSKKATGQKTIEVQLGELFNLNPQFQKLKNTMVSPEIAFDLRRYLVDVIGKNFDLIEEQRLAYVKEFSTAAEGQNPVVDREVDEKKHKQFYDALSKYFENKVTIPVCETVKMSDLEKSLKMAHRNYGSMIDVQMLIDLDKFFAA